MALMGSSGLRHAGNDNLLKKMLVPFLLYEEDR